MASRLTGLLFMSWAAAVTAAEPLPPLGPKVQEQVDGFLRAWEERAAALQSWEVAVTLTEIDPPGVRVQRTVYHGDVAALRPGFVKYFLRPVEGEDDKRKWVHEGTDGHEAWIVDCRTGAVQTGKMPQTGWLAELFVFGKLPALLFDVKAAAVKERFDVRIDPAAVDKDDPKYNPHYVALTVLPKSREDRRRFEAAQLVLWRSDDPKYADDRMLPARLWVQRPSKAVVMVEFKRRGTAGKLTAADFAAPSPPAGDTPKK